MAKIIREYKVTAKEFSIKTNDRNVVCIVGNHINGAYLVIPSFGISVELTDDGDIEENKYRIIEAFDNSKNTWRYSSSPNVVAFLAQEIAEVINPYITTEQTAEEYLKSIMGTRGKENGIKNL